MKIHLTISTPTSGEFNTADDNQRYAAAVRTAIHADPTSGEYAGAYAVHHRLGGLLPLDRTTQEAIARGLIRARWPKVAEIRIEEWVRVGEPVYAWRVGDLWRAATLAELLEQFE